MEKDGWMEKDGMQWNNDAAAVQIRSDQISHNVHMAWHGWCMIKQASNGMNQRQCMHGCEYYLHVRGVVLYCTANDIRSGGHTIQYTYYTHYTWSSDGHFNFKKLNL